MIHRTYRQVFQEISEAGWGFNFKNHMFPEELTADQLQKACVITAVQELQSISSSLYMIGENLRLIRLKFAPNKKRKKRKPKNARKTNRR